MTETEFAQLRFGANRRPLPNILRYRALYGRDRARIIFSGFGPEGRCVWVVDVNPWRGDIHSVELFSPTARRPLAFKETPGNILDLARTIGCPWVMPTVVF